MASSQTQPLSVDHPYSWGPQSSGAQRNDETLCYFIFRIFSLDARPKHHILLSLVVRVPEWHKLVFSD